MLPSGPVVILVGPLIPVPVKLETTMPAVVISPIELLPKFVNQRLPSGPDVIPCGESIPVPVKLETTPAGSYLADRVVAGIREPEIAVGTDGDGGGDADPGASVVGDNSGGRYLADRVVAGIREPEIAVWTRHHSGGTVDSGSDVGLDGFLSW